MHYVTHSQLDVLRLDSISRVLAKYWDMPMWILLLIDMFIHLWIWRKRIWISFPHYLPSNKPSINNSYLPFIAGMGSFSISLILYEFFYSFYRLISIVIIFISYLFRYNITYSTLYQTFFTSVSVRIWCKGWWYYVWRIFSSKINAITQQNGGIR